MPKVSVIIPTYNRANFVSRALKSVIKQGYNNIEIIVIDDGSTDNTESVVNSLQQTFPDIFYFKNERSKGPSGARNTGIIKSSCHYLSFLDSDDIWLEGHLIEGLKILDENPEIDVLFGNYSIVDFHSGKHRHNFFDRKKILHTLKSVQISPNIMVLQDDLFEALIQENFFSLGGLIIRKSSCDNVFFDESIGFAEDRDFAIRLNREANAKFAYRQNPVFIAYKHDSNFSTSTPDNPNTRQRVLEARLYLFKKYFRIYDLSNNEKRTLTKLISKLFLNLTIVYGRNKDYLNALSYAYKNCKCMLSSSFERFKALTKG